MKNGHPISFSIFHRKWKIQNEQLKMPRKRQRISRSTGTITAETVTYCYTQHILFYLVKHPVYVTTLRREIRSITLNFLYSFGQMAPQCTVTLVIHASFILKSLLHRIIEPCQMHAFSALSFLFFFCTVMLK